MDSMDYWRLCDELTVVQAALLIVGEDPSSCQEYIDGWTPYDRPGGYDAAIAALRHAIEGNRLTATTRYIVDDRFDPTAEEYFEQVTDRPDWHRTTVSVDDLKHWLRQRGIRDGFFFPTGSDKPDYLDPEHPRYAPKLAAAVRAWLAVEDPDMTRGKSAKQALAKWLREHAADFRLSDEEGKPNETGIEACARVANWQDKGGAPKTPTSDGVEPEEH